MSARLKGRWREVEQLLDRLVPWAAARTDLVALGVVGSYAYRRPHQGSDLDLMVLTHHLDGFGPWLGQDSPLAPADFLGTRQWGPVTEWRFRRRSGLQVELGVGLPGWAGARPLDAGTARVLADGIRILHDPYALLADARDRLR